MTVLAYARGVNTSESCDRPTTPSTAVQPRRSRALALTNEPNCARMLALPGVVMNPPRWVRCFVTNVGPTLVQIVPVVVVDGEVGQGAVTGGTVRQAGAELLFQIITEGEERASIAILASERTGYDVCAVTPRRASASPSLPGAARSPHPPPARLRSSLLRPAISARTRHDATTPGLTTAANPGRRHRRAACHCIAGCARVTGWLGGSPSRQGPRGRVGRSASGR